MLIQHGWYIVAISDYKSTGRCCSARPVHACSLRTTHYMAFIFKRSQIRKSASSPRFHLKTPLVQPLSEVTTWQAEPLVAFLLIKTISSQPSPSWCIKTWQWGTSMTPCCRLVVKWEWRYTFNPPPKNKKGISLLPLAQRLWLRLYENYTTAQHLCPEPSSHNALCCWRVI